MLAKISPMYLPDRVGRYVIDGLYSQGGMSRLLLGREDFSNKKAIIKILLPCFSSDKDLVERFITEGRILSVSSHQNIVQLYDYGYCQDGPYIAMEFIPGTPLSAVFKVRQVGLEEGLKIFLDVCQGIRHLHGHGIVHGDIKPDNILITSTNEVKIIDFGISKVTEDTNEGRQLPVHQFLGSPFYMAPEIQKDFWKISMQSDIYSLGIVAYELMTGQLSKGKIDVRLLPGQLGEIVGRALQSNPQDRYSSVDDLISDVSAYLLPDRELSEGKAFDYYFNLYGKLRQKHQALLHSLIPPMSSGMAVAYHCSLQGEGMYFRCMQQHSVWVVVAAKSVRCRADGITDTFRLHDAFEKMATNAAYTSQNISVIFEELSRQGIDFAYCSFQIDFQEKELQWNALGLGTLFAIYEDRVCTIGVSNQTFRRKYQPGEKFLIVGYPFRSEAGVSLITSSIRERSSELPKDIVNWLLKKILYREARFSENHSACLIFVHP